MNTYKIYIRNRVYKFATIEAAKEYAERVFAKTGVIVGISQ